MAKRLDVRGEICPYPMMKTSEALKKLPAGEALEVITDHAPALTTIPWEATKFGYAAQIERIGASEWRIALTPSATKRSTAEIAADLARQLEAVGAVEEE
jgi:TusA-related sulfurtransferase